MGFSIKTKINPSSKIIKDHGLDENGRVQRFLRDEADRLMNPYIPFKEGALRRNKTYPNNYSIKYTSPYSKYHYYGKLMLAKNGSAWAKTGEKKVLTNKNLQYHTSGTGPKWDKVMMQKRGKELEKDVQNFINSGGR